MTGFSGEIHPYAAGFRLLVGDELADLAAGIADGIADDPIILDQNGVLIDGRNRLAACELAADRVREHRGNG